MQGREFQAGDRSVMVIGHATTFWPNRFGHTHYTDALIRGMRSLEPTRHHVIGEHPSAPRDDEAVRCVPCFKRDQDYVEPIVQAARAARAEVLLLQYSNDLFGEDTRFPRLLLRLRQEGIKTVVNLHSIYPADWKIPFAPGGQIGHFDRAMAHYASCLNVHSRRMRGDLIARGVDPEKITVIPHGSKLKTPLDQQESLRALGFADDRRVVLFFGFIWLGKGLDFLLEVFGKVAKRVPEASFYIGGYTRERALHTRAYMTYLQGKIWALGIGRRTHLSGAYVPDEQVDTLYSAAEVVALPYKQDYSSVSGVVHQAAGYGKLMLCSRIAKFDEVEESIARELVVGYGDRRGWVDAMTRLLCDPAHAEELRGRVRRFAQNTSWDEVGRMHLALYEGLLDGRAPALIQHEHFPLEVL
jgi:glycosyltransferase involved in cell wall biosynthesis